MISSLGIPCSKLTPEIFFWKVNFSSKKNCLDGSTFPVVLFLLVQFIDLMTPRTQSLVNTKGPPFYFNTVGLFDLTTPLPIAITMRRPIAVPVARVSIIMVFIFFMKSSQTSFGRPFFLKIVFPSFSFFILSFKLLMVVLTKVDFGYPLLNRSTVALVP